MKFYTALPSIKVLKAVLGLVNKAYPYFCPGKPFAISRVHGYNSIKRCLNCPVQVLAYHLNVYIMCYAVYITNVFEVYDSHGQTRMHAHLMA